MMRSPLRALSAFACSGVLSTVAVADPLNPLEFPSAGAVTLAAGQTYTINSMTGTMTGPSLNLTGTYRGSTLVFAFDSLTVPATAVINMTGRKPVALLSRGDLTAAGTVSFNGKNGEAAVGGPGKGGDGAGCGGGGFPNQPIGSPFNTGGGIGGGSPAGGSFGGLGANGNLATYGNLLLCLEGGSGGSGGLGYGNFQSHGGGGGAGGGAVELGALGTLTLSTGAVITANGGNGGAPAATGTSGGGGSGGGILIHAASLQVINPAVQANGGNGGNVSTSSGGWRGGGGRIAVQSANTPVLTGFSVAPGQVGMQSIPLPQPGVITNSRVTLVAPDLDFGDVPVGSSRTLFMAARNTGDPDTSINGQFPDAAAPFARVGTGVFSSVRPGRAAANDYTFTPTTTGTFTQQLTFISNAGPVTVNVTGRGVLPSCIGDLNSDGAVNTLDLTQFLGAFGTACP